MTTNIHCPPLQDAAVRVQTASAPRPDHCIICSASSQRRFQISGIWIRQCDSCGHQFAEIADAQNHVEKVYGDDYFFAGGAGYANYLTDSHLFVQRAKWYAAQVAQHTRPGTMLDVGAAAGFTLRGFADAGWDVLGIEPNPQMADYARSEMHIAVEATSLETFDSGRHFDLISMLQVLPHFANPRAAIERAAQLLRRGGHLLMETWNRHSFAARLFGRAWHEYSPPSVLHWFSTSSLIRLLASEGFAVVSQGRPPRWISMAHAKSVLRNKANTSLTHRALLAASSVFPDRLSVPYPGDDLIWMLLRRGDAQREATMPIAGFAVEPAAALCK